MLTIREEELNKVNGGTVFGETYGGPKFKVGDVVAIKTLLKPIVGVVISRHYDEGWSYDVASALGIHRYPESALEATLL